MWRHQTLWWFHHKSIYFSWSGQKLYLSDNYLFLSVPKHFMHLLFKRCLIWVSGVFVNHCQFIYILLLIWYLMADMRSDCIASWYFVMSYKSFLHVSQFSILRRFCRVFLLGFLVHALSLFPSSKKRAINFMFWSSVFLLIYQRQFEWYTVWPTCTINVYIRTEFHFGVHRAMKLVVFAEIHHNAFGPSCI